MENPSFFHLLMFLYIGFAKQSNNDIPFEEEMAIKRKLAQWMDLSFRNVDQYEIVTRQTLEWYNSIAEDEKESSLMEVVDVIKKLEEIDEVLLKRILSEIRDIAVSNGKFDQGEKVLHDKIASRMGMNITTIDDHCEPLEKSKSSKTKKAAAKKEKPEKKQIGFRYGGDDEATPE